MNRRTTEQNCNSYRENLKKAAKSSLMSLEIILASSQMIFSGCQSKSFPISFICDSQTAEIYVDGNYIGTGGPIQYTVPAGAKQVEVECVVDGVIVFSRKYNVEGQKDVLFDIRIPQNMQYHTN